MGPQVRTRKGAAASQREAAAGVRVVPRGLQQGVEAGATVVKGCVLYPGETQSETALSGYKAPVRTTTEAAGDCFSSPVARSAGVVQGEHDEAPVAAPRLRLF